VVQNNYTVLFTIQAMEKYAPLRQSQDGNSSSQFLTNDETEPLSSHGDEFVYRPQINHARDKFLVAILYSIIGLLSIILIILPIWMKGECVDPSIGIWSTALSILIFLSS
jgi:hypothetical protein